VLNEVSQNASWCLLLWLTMITGSRCGEICALRWTDLDLDAALASVERSHSGTKEKSTKSQQKRRLALDAHTASLLPPSVRSSAATAGPWTSRSARTPSCSPPTRPAPIH
jgi:integrase